MRRFRDSVPNDVSWAKKHAGLTEYWLFDERLEEFGSNKWCGYDIETVDQYKREGDAINGHDAREQIEAVMDVRYKRDESLHSLLRGWTDPLFGSGSFDQIDESKWKFIRFRSESTNVDPAAITRMTSDVKSSDYFDAGNVRDARERLYREIVVRRGQQQFRCDLAVAYEERCAITGADFLPVLEAAHIMPYRGPQTNHVTNGLLLRADIHVLFDLNFIGINPSTMTVEFSDQAIRTEYCGLHGKEIRLPARREWHPDHGALAERWNEFSALHRT